MAPHGTPVIGKDSRWRLIVDKTKEQVKVGDEHKTFQDDLYVVTGGAYPHKSGSTGRVYCRLIAKSGDTPKSMEIVRYPNVLGLKWVWGV